MLLVSRDIQLRYIGRQKTERIEVYKVCGDEILADHGKDLRAYKRIMVQSGTEKLLRFA